MKSFIKIALFKLYLKKRNGVGLLRIFEAMFVRK